MHEPLLFLTWTSWDWNRPCLNIQKAVWRRLFFDGTWKARWLRIEANSISHFLNSKLGQPDQRAYHEAPRPAKELLAALGERVGSCPWLQKQKWPKSSCFIWSWCFKQKPQENWEPVFFARNWLPWRALLHLIKRENEDTSEAVSFWSKNRSDATSSTDESTRTSIKKAVIWGAPFKTAKHIELTCVKLTSQYCTTIIIDSANRPIEKLNANRLPLGQPADEACSWLCASSSNTKRKH